MLDVKKPYTGGARYPVSWDNDHRHAPEPDPPAGQPKKDDDQDIGEMNVEPFARRRMHFVANHSVVEQH